ALAIVMKLASRRNVNDVIAMLRKELTKTVTSGGDQQQDKASDYRLLLIQTIHTCAGEFPEVAADVVDLFLDSISEFGASSATDAIIFVREVAEKFPALRQNIIKHLVSSFLDFKTGKVIRGALWILGEYAESGDEIRDVWTKLREAIGELPLLAAEQRELEAAKESGDKSPQEQAVTVSVPASRRVLPDGTYATESAMTAVASTTIKLDSKPPLRAVLLHSDFFTGTVLASTLAKLVLRFAKLEGESDEQLNSLRAEAVLIMAGVIRIGQSTFVSNAIDEDSYDRVLACIRALEYMDEDADVLTGAFISDTQSAFARLVKGEAKREREEKKLHSKETAVQVDDAIGFRL
ncbi:coatomer subunit beta, partial [Coemansia sp. S85]